MKPKAVFYAVLAAVCYGVSAPLSKLLLMEVPPVLMAALLYLGAGLGMGAVSLARGAKQEEAKLGKRDFKYVAGMVVLDIGAPIFLMLGLTTATPATVSLMNNFEIVATALLALLLFKEAVGARAWLAILLITLASVLLSVEDFKELRFSIGALYVLLACVCWGLENNCTRMLALKDPLRIVVIKGFGSGLGALAISFFAKEAGAGFVWILLALMLGFMAYGLSVFFYIHAQRYLGAARTSAYYAVAPFIGVALSLFFFGQSLPVPFWVALLLMVGGSLIMIFEDHGHEHIHEQLIHEHRHDHADGHHGHTHEPPVSGEHSHAHEHEQTVHAHKHTPDLHHTHAHRKL